MKYPLRVERLLLMSAFYLVCTNTALAAGWFLVLVSQ